MKILSPLPRPTTLVSPVTIRTPARPAARWIEPSTRRRSASGNPSSRMNASDSASGRAPPTARSFTVPFTARSPMSPPGKKIGVTTYESVVNASREASSGTMAWSSSTSRSGFRNAGTIMRSISWAPSLPPLPWPSRISSACVTGSGHSPKGPAPLEDIVGSQRDVHEIPEQVQQQGVRLLDAMDRPGPDREAVVAELRHATAVAPREAHRQQAELARPLERTRDVRRRAGRGESERDVDRTRDQGQLIGEHAREVAVVADGRERGRVDGQRLGGQGAPLLDDRMHELHRHVLGVARRAAVAHHPERRASPETLRHVAHAALERLGVLLHEGELGVGALARLAEDGVPHAAGSGERWRPYW